MGRKDDLHQFSIDHLGRVREENFAAGECNAEMQLDCQEALLITNMTISTSLERNFRF